MKPYILNKLKQLYEKGEIKAGKRLLKDPDILFLMNHTKEIYLFGDLIRKTNDFDVYFESQLKQEFIN